MNSGEKYRNAGFYGFLMDVHTNVNFKKIEFIKFETNWFFILGKHDIVLK